jgi:hypothetical protein
MHAAATMTDGAAFLPWLDHLDPPTSRGADRTPRVRMSLAERAERFLDRLLRPAPTMKLTLRHYPY